jgi:hypothetical protein
MITYKRVPINRNIQYVYKRNLLVGGKILVNVDEIVQPETILTSGWQKSGYRVFDLASLFGTKPEKIQNSLQRTVGSRVYKGDIVAIYRQWFGLREKVFRSPVTGTLIDYNPEKTKITLQYLPVEVRLPAGFSAKVLEIRPDEYIKIGTKVDAIKGVVGFGKEREASLIEIGYPDIPIHPDQISEKHSDKIIFGGTKVSLEALYKALSMGVKAIITGGIEYEDFIRLNAGSSEGRFEDVGLSIIITEGFGSLPIYPAIYNFLKDSEHRHIVVTPEKELIIIPIPVDKLNQSDLSQLSDKNRIKTKRFGLLKLGQKVRVLRDDRFGEYGILSNASVNEGQVEVTLEKDHLLVKPTDLEIIDE